MHADIRPARASDIEALLSIENSVFETDRLSRRSFQHHVKSRTALLLVLEREGGIAGYALLLFRDGSRVARLYSIAVMLGRERRGLGKWLLSAAEGAALSRGCILMRLEVREENQRALELYQRTGYRRIGKMHGYYQDGTAALRLEKDLRA
ncbi:N-acetyltransferase [Chelativorans sp. Marseille-P2723]|uniref:GNAT family N-acetyltransferase n=1 Tax=Chelativorans sp. Marseille-P2723 TaxID=2709133 RepID=UPI00156FF807|nr:N-acetyltransferase [Chelativorans sp. Marseille-P2723]